MKIKWKTNSSLRHEVTLDKAWKEREAVARSTRIKRAGLGARVSKHDRNKPEKKKKSILRAEKKMLGTGISATAREGLLVSLVFYIYKKLKTDAEDLFIMQQKLQTRIQ